MLNYAQLGRIAGSNPSTRKFVNFVQILAALKPNLLKDRLPSISWNATNGILTLRIGYKLKGEEKNRVFTVNCSKAVAKELTGKEFPNGAAALKHIASTYPIQVIDTLADGTELEFPLFKFSMLNGTAEEISFADLSKLFVNQPEVEYADVD